MASDGKRKLKCVECNRTKGLHLFYKRSQTKRGYTRECKACFRKGPSFQKALDRRYQSDFGITLAEYNAILREQGGRCFICWKRPARRRLAVDHDHAKERTSDMRSSVRGLLCGTCNEFLGHIGDQPNAGSRLKHYLQRPFWAIRR